MYREKIPRHRSYLTLVLEKIGIITLFLVSFQLPGIANDLYVKPGGTGTGTSWDDALGSIQEAIGQGLNVEKIYIAGGDYPENIVTDSFTELYGGYEALSGSPGNRDIEIYPSNILGTTESDHTVTISDVIDVILNGFTVTGSGQTKGLGGGIYCINSSLSIIDCKITNNSAIKGGGIYCQNSSPTITRCTIIANTAEEGGGIYIATSTPTLTNCLITGNTATARTYSAGGGLSCNNASPVLTNCTFSGNVSNGGSGGISCVENSNPSLTNCLVTGNLSRGSGGALLCYESSPALVNCTFANNENSAFGVGGLFCISNSYPFLTNCILWNKGIEILTPQSDSIPQVTFCTVQGGWPGNGNLDSPPRFFDPASENFKLEDHSPCIDRGSLAAAPETDIDGNLRPGGDGKTDIGAYEAPDDYSPDTSPHTPGILYVNVNAFPGGDGQRWESALTSISSALKIASTSDEIWVAAGTYSEFITMEPDIQIFGGFRGDETTLDARDWTTQETTINASGLKAPAVIGADKAGLNGFKITGGNSEFGGGIACYSASPRLANCLITENSTSAGGGGIKCQNGSSPTIINCTLTANSAGYGGGIHCYFGSSPKLMNCTITENSADRGGGIECHFDSFPQITDCSISNNNADFEGGGARIGERSTLTFIGSTISGNSAKSGGGLSGGSMNLTTCSVNHNSATSGGGIYLDSGSSEVSNCVISDNTGFDGAGLYLRYGTLEMKNSLITGNTAKNTGGGIYSDNATSHLTNCNIIINSATESTSGASFYNSATALRNCILWGPGSDLLISDEQSLTINHCCLQENWPGEGNLNEDPLFVDPENGDFHLRSESPCIDSGTSTNAPSTDLEGNRRPVDIPGLGKDGQGAYDVGVYEKQIQSAQVLKGQRFFFYSVLWNREETAIPPPLSETDFILFDTFVDETIDWKDILATLDIIQSGI